MRLLATAFLALALPSSADTAQKPISAYEIRSEYRTGPGVAPMALLLVGANGLDYYTTRQRLDAGTGYEAGPVARHMSPEARFIVAVGVEAAVVEFAKRKGKPRLAWGLLAGFAAGHLILAGCNHSGGCW